MTALEDFVERFGFVATVAAEAPGRVNLIGEHTDYNDGFVLPVAIPQRTQVALAARTDDRVSVVSSGVAAEDAVVEYRLGTERRAGGWKDYVQGCTAMLRDAGYRIGGFDAAITSEVPIGAGLSSSAALEVAVLRALRAAFDLRLDDVALALLAHRAEVELVGARVGVMDQMAASLADETSALFLDTRALGLDTRALGLDTRALGLDTRAVGLDTRAVGRAQAWERVPLPAGATLAVIDSGIAHRHASGGYNARRAECEQAAALLGVPTLRDLGPDALTRAAGLPPPLDRRVRHVVTENARVLGAVAAMKAGDVGTLGAILRAGHVSLCDDYEVSTPEIEALVGAANADPDVLGARLTGGGFGGAVVLLVRGDGARPVAERVAASYAKEHAGGRVLVPAGATTSAEARTA